jgi:hypothetical protein
VYQANSFPEAQTISAEEMNVNVARATVFGKLEVMVFNIPHTVAHF